MNNTLNCANASLTHLCTVHINITKETKHSQHGIECLTCQLQLILSMYKKTGNYQAGQQKRNNSK